MVGIAAATTRQDVADIAKDFDVVIHEASASNVEWIKGLIDGQEMKSTTSRRRPIFMYGGGTGVMEDACHGDNLTDKIWSVSRICFTSGNVLTIGSQDYDYKGLESLPSTAMHREGDLLATSAAKRGKLEVYHLSPGLVYGRGTGPVNKISKQVPALVRIAMARRQAQISVKVWESGDRYD
jgi:hypothetical protein